MKKKYVYLLVITGLFAILLSMFIYSNSTKTKIIVESTSKSLGSNHSQEGQDLKPASNASDSIDSSSSQAIREKQAKNNSGLEHFFLQGLRKLDFDISRDICMQEQKLLVQTLEPQDSKHRLSVNELISLLKKTANSKCSSFRKNNAQELFFRFKLDESNYKSFLKHFDLLLGDYQGTLPLKLMRASIQELKQAKPEEIKPLREAIIYSLSTTINDSSAFIDVGVSVAMLKELHQEGLISGLTLTEIDAFGKEFKEEMQRQITVNNSSRKNHDYPLGKMDEYLNYEDAKIELKLMQDEYQAVEQFREKLIGLMERSFK